MMEETNKNVYWDPAIGGITEAEVKSLRENISLRNKYERIKNNPGYIKRNLFLLIIIGLLIIIVGEALIYFITEKGSGESGEYFIYPFMAAAVPYFSYRFAVKELQKDLVNYQLASRLQWIYDPDLNATKWEQLKVIFPEIFDCGDSGQFIDNQFWGKLADGRDFWLGQFHYTTKSGDSSTTHLYTTYAFKLANKVPADFVLSPKNPFSGTISKIRGKQIETESNDFNKEFQIEYKGDRGLMGADILQTLSPDVMEKLYEYEAKNKDFKMSFSGSNVVVSFEGHFETKYTNFAKSATIDERDITEISNRIMSSTEIADNILPKIE